MARPQGRGCMTPSFNTDNGIRRATIAKLAVADNFSMGFNTDNGIRRATIFSAYSLMYPW